MARKGAAGHPERFITPTTNPEAFNSPQEAARALRRAWTTIMQEIRRKWPGVQHEYMAVFEVTKAGWPHLHVLYRGCYIPQAWLSEKMRLYIQSPIVDIRKVKGKKDAAKYVAKYLSKAPKRMESCYRHSCSRKWVIDIEPSNPFAWKNFEGKLELVERTPQYIRLSLNRSGYEIEGSGSYFEARPPPKEKIFWHEFQEPIIGRMYAR